MNLKDRYYVLIDTETTGLDKDKHQLLEIGMLIIKGMQIVESFEVKIKHKDYTINTTAMKHNKINLIEHEEEAYDEKSAAELMLYILNKYISENDKGMLVIGQNIEFDLGFLEKMFLRVGKIKEYRKCISYRKLDIQQVAIGKSIEGKIELEATNLDTILNALDIEIPEGRHRALTDCYLEFSALTRLLAL